LLDEAVIRNTNTKIILRLPDAEDRALVGKAAALNDKQIEELAKLPRGVAAVYQNDWVEAVLCQFRHFKVKEQLDEVEYELPKGNRPSDTYLEKLFNIRNDIELVQEDVDNIVKWIAGLPYPDTFKAKLRKVLLGEQLTEKEMEGVAYTLFDGIHLAKYLNDTIEPKVGIDVVDKRIKSRYNIENDAIVTVVRQSILQYVSEHMKTDAFEKRYVEFMGRRHI